MKKKTTAHTTGTERIVVISDLHIPDHNQKALSVVIDALKKAPPEKLIILGDFMNFTKVSKYTQDPYYHIDIFDEIAVGKKVLKSLVNACNGYSKIYYFAGNHEDRLIRYLAKNADQLAELDVDGEKVISIQHLFELKKLNVKWFNYNEGWLYKGIYFTHGNIARVKGGFTAQAMLDKYATSGISGHTHRMAFVTRTQRGNTKFWIETGCLCNLQPTPSYVTYPDWCNGYVELEIEKGRVQPKLITL